VSVGHRPVSIGHRPIITNIGHRPVSMGHRPMTLMTINNIKLTNPCYITYSHI
jgi:hypothetical protein